MGARRARSERPASEGRGRLRPYGARAGGNWNKRRLKGAQKPQLGLCPRSHGEPQARRPAPFSPAAATISQRGLGGAASLRPGVRPRPNSGGRGARVSRPPPQPADASARKAGGAMGGGALSSGNPRLITQAGRTLAWDRPPPPRARRDFGRKEAKTAGEGW